MDELFSTISECQQLYPDAEISSEEEQEGGIEDVSVSEEGNYYTTPEGLQGLTAEGERVLQHLESILRIEGSGENGMTYSNFGLPIYVSITIIDPEM